MGSEILHAALRNQKNKIAPLNKFVIPPTMIYLAVNFTPSSPPTLHSSLLILHPLFFTLNPTPSILHPSTFSLSLTSKKPFLLSDMFREPSTPIIIDRMVISLYNEGVARLDDMKTWIYD